MKPAARKLLTDRFGRAADLPCLLLSNINMGLCSGLAELIFQRIRGTGFHKGNHIFPGYAAGIPVIILKQLLPEVQGLKLQPGKTSDFDQAVATAESRAYQGMGEL